MKFGQVTEYNKRNIFVNNHAKNEVDRLVPDLFCFFFKLYMTCFLKKTL